MFRFKRATKRTSDETTRHPSPRGRTRRELLAAGAPGVAALGFGFSGVAYFPTATLAAPERRAAEGSLVEGLSSQGSPS